uniref:Uncharacterized protein n=1 Tax=Siphoviridae sp. ctP0x5 TaxID=2827863 RepID=A0A8S5TF80_9CAUD|nr:MAG TPA: hypothetical protein [Siphoviridae sp. ctP0x5]DAG16552.1 MAG TPA: hypothetical protein [Caudoviricetes sp.]
MQKRKVLVSLYINLPCKSRMCSCYSSTIV